jgi:uncharacterized protein YrrD
MNELDLNISAQVHCKDGLAGRLSKVVVDPADLRVTNLIIEAGLLLKHARVVPIEIVDSAGEEDIYLSVPIAALADFPEYREKEFERPATEWDHPKYTIDNVLIPGHGLNYGPTLTMKEKLRQGISAELEVVKQGTPIKNSGGTIGKLDQVIADSATNEITFLVILRGTLFPSRINLPVFLVERVSEEEILVDITEEELDRLAGAEPKR